MEWFKLALSKYAVFSGRSRRKEYWYFVLFNALIGIVAGLIDLALGLSDPDTGMGPVGGLYSLAMIIPGLAVAVRRLHDTGRTGWWLLLGLIPLIGAIVLIVFLVEDSAPGGNAYGPNPKTGDLELDDHLVG